MRTGRRAERVRGAMSEAIAEATCPFLGYEHESAGRVLDVLVR